MSCSHVDVEENDSNPVHMISQRRYSLNWGAHGLLVRSFGSIASLDTRVGKSTIVNNRRLRVARFGVDGDGWFGLVRALEPAGDAHGCSTLFSKEALNVRTDGVRDLKTKSLVDLRLHLR